MEELTPQEFAAKIKEKYPQYKDVEDSVLVEKMLTKYPEYKNKVKFPDAVEPKGEVAELENGASGSTSAVEGSLSESNQNNKPDTLESTAVKLGIDSIPSSDTDPNEVLSSMEDGGLSYKEKASRAIQDRYEQAGLKNYSITDPQIAREALSIYEKDNSTKKEAKKYEDWDFWGDTWKKVKANTNTAIAGITGLPNYFNKTLFTLLADDSAIDFANTLEPEAREVFINSTFNNPSSPLLGDIGQASAEAQNEFLAKADAIQQDIVQFDNNLTDDLANGDYGKFSKRVASEGIGSIPSIVQTLIPYVGITSVIAGSAANKQEELENEGYGLGLDTSANAAISGVAEGLLEITTKKLGSKLFKSLGKVDDVGRGTILRELGENLVKAPAYEGGSEAATSLIQNLSDMYVQGKEKEFNEVFKEVADSFFVGFAVGGAMGATTQTSLAVRDLKNDIKIQAIVNDKSNTYKSVKDIFNPSIKDINIDQAAVVAMGGSRKFDNDLSKAVSSGELTQFEADEYKDKFNNTMLAVSKTQGVSMSAEDRVKASNLILKKDKLTSQIKNLDGALAAAKKLQVEKIDAELMGIVGINKDTKADGKTGETKTETTGTKSGENVGATENVVPTKTTNAEQGDVQAEGEKELNDAASDTQNDVANEAVTPEQKTVYQNTAKAIRSAKIYKTPSEALNKLSSNPAGLLAVAWDGALETVATTVELTGNLDAAIRKGVSQIKQSEWYKNLSPEDKKEALGIIENDLRSNLTPLAESVVPKSKQSTKATIRKTTGQVDQSKKFTISEAKLLKEQFKNLAKGSAIGAKSVMEDKKGFIKDISSQLKSLVNSKVMTTTEATRVLSAVNQFNGKNVDKVQPLVDKVVDAIEKRGLSRNIKAQKSKLRKAAKSSRNPVNIRGLAKAATKVNEKYLDSSSQKEYNDLLSEIGNAVATPTSKKYNMAVEEEMYSRLNDLNEKAEKARIDELAATMGLEGQGLSESELRAIWEADNVDEYVDTLKEDKAKAARLALEKQAEYAIIALNDVDGTQLSEQERKDVRELKNADLTLLSSTDIRDLIKIVDNIVLNEDFSSSGEIVSKVRSYNASKEAMSHFSKDEVNMIRKSVITDLKSVALIFKKVFMSAKRSATFNRLSGLSKLSMSYTRHRKAMDKLAVDYNDLFRNLKKKNSSIIKPENTMFRGLVGQLIQGTTAEDFSINKSRVEDHLTQIKKNQSQGLREGAEKLQQEYDKIKDLKSQDEVIEYTKNLNDGNWDIIDFWLKHFESTKDALKYNTEVVHGKSFEEVSGNYLPIKMKGDIQHSVDVDNEAFFNVNGLPASNPSTTTISRTKTKKLPKDRILDLDFDSVMFNKANAVSIDIETSADYKDVYNFFRSPNMEEMFGRETLDVFNKKVKEMRRVQLGISSMDVSQDEITKNITKVERMWKSVGTSIALGGLTQYPKQYFSVVTNIIPNLGKHGGLMFKAMFTDKSNMPILDMVSISMRGETQGGTVTASTRISEAEKKATKAMVGRIVQETGLVAEKVRNALFFSLRKGDVNVAKSSWVAFYQASLLDQGVDSRDIDMTTEHEKLDDVRRQQAISYAELKVEETQIASDDSRGSEFYQSKEAYKAILRSLLLPFQSFNINSKMRMLNDLNILGSQRSNTEQKLEAARSLLGTASEIVTFQTMKYYILAPLIGLGKDAIIELFGLDSPDEDEEQQKEFKFKQWYSALAKDLNPLTIGAFAEDMNIEVLNYLQYLQEGDSDEEYIDFIKRTRDDGGQLFYRYKDKEERNKGFGASLLNGGGLYAIPMTQFGEASETFDLMMKGTKRDDYGNLNEYDFSDEEKAFLRVAFAIELTSLFGLGEADTRRMFTQIRRDLLRNTDKQKIN